VVLGQVRHHPDSCDLRTRLGLCLLRLGPGAFGSSDAAREHLAAACALDPTSVPARLGWGSVAQDERPDQALLEYRVAVAEVR
jgi:hypothetical protein